MRTVRFGAQTVVLYSTPEVAKRLRTSPSNVLRLIRWGLLRTVRFPGRRFAIPEKEVLWFLAEIGPCPPRT